jgi:hypothetical protein
LSLAVWCVDLAGEPVHLGVQGGDGGVGLPQLLLATGQRVGEGAALPVCPARELLEPLPGLLHGRVQGVAARLQPLALRSALVELLHRARVLRRQRPFLPAPALRLGRVACGGPLRRTMLLPRGLRRLGLGRNAGVLELGGRRPALRWA